ncbi:MAG: hypothetical protein AAFN93_14665 [Bacteroidota bacterium]
MTLGRKYIISLFILITCWSYQNVFAQGCSDAGFCTMGAMRPGQSYTRHINFKLRSIEINQYRGSTTLSPIIYATAIDLNFGISSNTSFQFKLPYQWVEGDMGSTSGLSDISVSLTTTFIKAGAFRLNATLGGKIPTNRSDLKDNRGRVLPMYYQTSLGSYDFIAGVSLTSRKWLLATGVQMALTENDNRFTYNAWNDYTDQEYLRSHSLAAGLRRGTDIMFRVERNFRFSNFNFNVGLLPIYRLNRDKIDDSETELRFKQNDTNGLALTLIFGVEYHFNIDNSVKFLLGRKYIDREVNPDGLTRHQVLSLSYITRF